MKLPKNVIYLLYLFLISLGLALRAGYTPQHGGDTWVSGIRADIISKNGAATWVLSPLSYFGWYPYSYPTGEHLLLSAFSQSSSLKIDATAYIISCFFGLFGTFAIYLLAREIHSNDLFAFTTTLIFSTFFYTVNSSWNEVSTRLLFIMLYPIAIFFLIRSHKHRGNMNIFTLLSACVILIIGSIHRIILLFFGIILIPYIILVLWNGIKKKINLNLNPKKTSIIFSSAFILLFINNLIGHPVEGVSKGFKYILPGNDPLSFTINLGASYGVLYGMTAVLAPIGIIYLIAKRKRKFSENLLITISLIAILFILNLQYFMSFFPPIASLLAGMGFAYLLEIGLEKNRTATIFIFIIMLLLSIQYFSWYVEKEKYPSLVLGLVGFILVILVLSFLVINLITRKIILILFVGYMLVNTSYVVASVNLKAVEYASQYPYEGKLAGETGGYNRALWVREYAQGGFIAEGAGIRNPLWAISGVQSAASYLEIADNDALRSMLKPEFNASLIWEDRQRAFEYEIPARYDPKRIERQVLSGDRYIAEMYKVNFIILTYGETEDYQYKKMIPYLEDNRYNLYCDNSVRVYHYSYFK